MHRWAGLGVIADNLINFGTPWKNRRILKPSDIMEFVARRSPPAGLALPAIDHTLQNFAPESS
jgi:hypothetical protein